MVTPTDEGFPSNRFGICVICGSPFEQGDRIATAPAAYFKVSRTGATIRLGHLSCVLDARKDCPDAPPAEARPSVARPESVPCDVCHTFHATVDVVIRRTGRVHVSLCGQCAMTGVQGDWDRLDEHAKAFGKNSLTRVEDHVQSRAAREDRAA
jgi:hypothetical protein